MPKAATFEDDVAGKDFDQVLRTKLQEEFDNKRSNEFISAYGKAKSDLQSQILKEIGRVETSLTDHGPDHILNVQENALRLVPPSIENALNAVELYLLGMSILFHDAGNIFGREDHRNNVARIYAQIRGSGDSLRRERTLIVRATRAHSGTGIDGSNDTLKDLDEIDHLYGHPIRLRELAAILRFADELAEGPQRTSDFMRHERLYDHSSLPYHEYASSTHILIDRIGQRIAVAYEIDVPASSLQESRENVLAKRLEFIFQRIIKMNQERQYARYYSDLLSPFRTTEISLNFHCGVEPMLLEIAPLTLTDIVVPGEKAKDLAEIDPSYSVDSLVTQLLEHCPEESTKNET